MKLRILTYSLFFGLLPILFWCHPEPSAGEKLADTYCSSCHLKPAPTDLNREIWATKVLPLMGAMHGIYGGKTGQIISRQEKKQNCFNTYSRPSS